MKKIKLVLTTLAAIVACSPAYAANAAETMGGSCMCWISIPF